MGLQSVPNERQQLIKIHSFTLLAHFLNYILYLEKYKSFCIQICSAYATPQMYSNAKQVERTAANWPCLGKSRLPRGGLPMAYSWCLIVLGLIDLYYGP